MGIDTNYVLPVKDHLKVFNCVICTNIVSLDGYVTTPCQHTFCKKCFDGWLVNFTESKYCDCPNCGVEILADNTKSVEMSNLQVQPIAMAQPLAHRMLGKVKVLCPCRLTSQFCSWTGNYEKLDQHMSEFHSDGKVNASDKLHGKLEQVSDGSAVQSQRSASFSLKSSDSSSKHDDHIRCKSEHVKDDRKSRSMRNIPNCSSSVPKENIYQSKAAPPSFENRRKEDSDSRSSRYRSHSSDNAEYFVQPLNDVKRKSSLRRSFSSNDIDDVDSSHSSRLPRSELTRKSSRDTPSSNDDSRHTTTSHSSRSSRPELTHKSSRGCQSSSDESKSTSSRDALARNNSSRRSRSNQDGHRSSRSTSREEKINRSSRHGISDKRSLSPKKSGSRSPPNSPRHGKADLERMVDFKDKANTAFKEGNHKDAVNLYSEAIDYSRRKNSHSSAEKESLATLYGNRAAAHLKLERFELCLSDCNTALSLNKNMPKVRLRKAWTLKEMGRLDQAKKWLSDCIGNNPGSKDLEDELLHTEQLIGLFSKVESYLDRKEYPKAKIALTKLRGVNINANILGCRADLGLGKADDVIKEITTKISRIDPCNPDVLVMLGKAHLQNGDCDQAIQSIKSALRLRPDSEDLKSNLQSMKEVKSNLAIGISAYSDDDYERSCKAYSQAINSTNDQPNNSPLRRLLLVERSNCNLKLHKFKDVLEDTKNVLLKDEACVLAWVARVRAFQALRDYDSISSELCTIVGNLRNRFLQEAFEEALDPPAFIDFYQVFGVSRTASVDEIKKKYKLLVRESHPDKFMNQKFTDDERREAEEKFKLLGEGLALLSDSFQRSLYDAGHDLDSIRMKADAKRRQDENHVQTSTKAC